MFCNQSRQCLIAEIHSSYFKAWVIFFKDKLVILVIKDHFKGIKLLTTGRGGGFKQFIVSS